MEDMHTHMHACTHTDTHFLHLLEHPIALMDQLSQRVASLRTTGQSAEPEPEPLPPLAWPAPPSQPKHIHTCTHTHSIVLTRPVWTDHFRAAVLLYYVHTHTSSGSL